VRGGREERGTADIKSPPTNFGGTDRAGLEHFLPCPHTTGDRFIRLPVTKNDNDNLWMIVLFAEPRGIGREV
jgi:hypothetical protein